MLVVRFLANVAQHFEDRGDGRSKAMANTLRELRDILAERDIQVHQEGYLRGLELARVCPDVVGGWPPPHPKAAEARRKTHAEVARGIDEYLSSIPHHHYPRLPGTEAQAAAVWAAFRDHYVAKVATAEEDLAAARRMAAQVPTSGRGSERRDEAEARVKLAEAALGRAKALASAFGREAEYIAGIATAEIRELLGNATPAETTKIRRVVLGARDHEMDAIQDLAEGLGIAVVEATANGARVHPGVAYRADSPAPEPGDAWIECRPAGVGRTELAASGVIAVDHHNPGDSGAGYPPEEAVKASSLGQLAELLGVELTPDQKITAALDHSLGATLQGRVKGVDAEAAFRVAVARHPEKPSTSDIERAEQALRTAPIFLLGDVQLRDLRDAPLPDKRGQWDSGAFRGLPIVAARMGVAYIARVRTRATDSMGPEKWVIGGWGAGPAVEALLAGALGPGKTYGSPERGFGGYYPPAE